MSLFKSISWFLAAVLLAKIVGMAQSFVIAKAMSPESFGVWVTLLLIVSYSPIVALGAVETLVKEVPYHLGRKDFVSVKRVERSVLGCIVLAAAVILVLGGIAAWLPAEVLSFDPRLLWPFVWAVVTSCFTGYFYWRLTAYECFGSVAAVDTCRSIFSMLFVGGMAWVWGLWGAVLGYLVQELITFLIAAGISVRKQGAVGVSFERGLLIHAVKVGFPITLLWWVLTLQAGVDRVVLGGMVGPAAVGLYGVGISLTGALALVPMVVGRVLYPRVNREHGKGGIGESLKSVVIAPTLALGALLINLQLFILACLPILFEWILPKYHEGLAAAQLLIIGSYFVCLLRNGANYLIATHNERRFLKFLLLALAFNVVVDVAFVQWGWGIEGIAIGTSLAGLLLTTLVWRAVFAGFGFSATAGRKRLMTLYAPILILMGTLGALRLLYASFFHTFGVGSIVAYFVLLALINAGLWCLPTYRSEMQRWRERARWGMAALGIAPRAADPAS